MKLAKISALFIIVAAVATLPVQAQTGGFDRTLQVSGPVSLDVTPSRSWQSRRWRRSARRT